MSDDQRQDRARIRDAIESINADRDREHMAPTIAAFHALLEQYPGDPAVLSEVGGAYDTAGQEAQAAEYYEQALAAGLEGTELRRCLLQYGSTLRNLGRPEDAIEVFEHALDEFPRSRSIGTFMALALHSAGRSDAAVATLVDVILDTGPRTDVDYYGVALTGYAAELRARDRSSTSSSA
jgi:tetratricopeptide (TPR) repeat protein